jgi:hypothetical protein
MTMLATNSDSHQRGVITLAYGPPRFVEQARSLAHSLQVHAPHLPRTLVTDSHNPSIRKLFTQVIAYRPEFGSGVRQKVFLDHYSPYEETLFIDSDCLVLGKLDSFWAAFGGQIFGVPGYRYLKKGEVDPYLDVDHALNTLNVSQLPKFNGGTYYFARSPQTTDFFNTARNFLDNFSSLRLSEFRRNGPADEAIYSLAMAAHDLPLTSMGPGGMWTPCGYKGSLRLDALAGTCSFFKEGMMLSPEVVHFPGEYAYAYAYARERARLKSRVEGKSPAMSSLAGSYVKAALWQSSRNVSALSKVGRAWVRTYRRATGFSSVNGSTGSPVNGAVLKSGLRQ